MSKKIFTSEEIETLKKNKYVKNVSEKGITYTNEFREDFAALLTNGKKTTEIFRILGFDTKILGETRIYSTTNRIKTMIKNKKTFDDTRTTHSGRPKNENLTLEEELERLKHEKALLEQENEFLKKMRYLAKQIYWKKFQQQKSSK